MEMAAGHSGSLMEISACAVCLQHDGKGPEQAYGLDALQEKRICFGIGTGQEGMREDSI